MLRYDDRCIGKKPKPFVKEFKEAGLIVYNGENNYAVIGASKGGVIKEFDKNAGVKLKDDCGYIGKLKTGKMISTQMQIWQGGRS